MAWFMFGETSGHPWDETLSRMHAACKSLNARTPLSAPGSGKEERTLLDIATERYGSVDGLGNLRVNGSAATLETVVREGQTILIIPKVEGGCVSPRLVA